MCIVMLYSVVLAPKTNFPDLMLMNKSSTYILFDIYKVYAYVHYDKVYGPICVYRVGFSVYNVLVITVMQKLHSQAQLSI